MDDALSAAWLASSIGRYAAAYAKTSYVIPLHGITADLKCTCGNPDCRSQGKHPFTKHGLKDASNDIEKIARLFNYRSDLNLGLITGEISGFFAVDIDGKKGGFESLDKLSQTYGEFEPTVIVKTGGGGVHIWFAYPVGLQIGNRTNLMQGIDIRGNNGYVVAVPSRHVSGTYYELTETSAQNTIAAPQWLLDMVQTKKKEEIEPLKADHSTGARSEWMREDVQKMLDVLDPDITYQEWVEIGMAIHSGGFPLSIWDAWSRTGSKFQNGDCEKRWHGFDPNHGITMGTLVHAAQLHGWKPAVQEREAVDISNIQPLVKKAQQLIIRPVAIKKHIPLLGFNAMEVPGLIGDTVRWIAKYAIRKQPELALLNTLAFAGAVFGRRYASPLNTRTNLYTVGIASTGAGKDASRKAMKELAHAAGLDERIGADDIRSDAGMLRGLMNNSSQLMMLDEFGLFLQGLSNEKSPHYIRAQAKILLKLYSASNSVYNHGDYADARTTPIIIQAPNLCIYGTSTEETYVKALRKSAIESGELNRFVVIKARNDKEYPNKEMPEYQLDDDLVKRWGNFSAKFGSSIGEIVNSSTVAPDPVTIKWGECDEIRYAIQCKQVDKVGENSPFRHLWDRLFENTVKIAMIFAIARNRKQPEFEPLDFDIGQMIVESSIEYLTTLAQGHMSETPQEEGNNEVLNAIKEAGGSMGRRDIMRKFRKLKKRDLDEIINSLIEQEVLDTERLVDEGRGRPKTVYRIAKEAAVEEAA